MAQPMLLEVSAPVKIVGDIHGQYHDLIRVFDKCGYPGDASYPSCVETMASNRHLFGSTSSTRVEAVKRVRLVQF